MSRSIVFPDPTCRGDRWDVYAAERTILPVDTAAAIAVEADWLCYAGEGGEGYVSTYEFTPGDVRYENHRSHVVRLQADTQPHLLEATSQAAAVRRRIPNLLRFIDDVQNRTGVAKSDAVINHMRPDGIIGRHVDAQEDTVVAIGLAGFAWASLANLDGGRQRFRLGPGNGFVLHNFGDEGLRPVHGVGAVGGVDRLSLAV